MLPDPPNLQIYSVFLALAAADPLQCKFLEPPVDWRMDGTLVTLVVASALGCQSEGPDFIPITGQDSLWFTDGHRFH